MVEHPSSWTIEHGYVDAHGRRHDLSADQLEKIAAGLSLRGDETHAGVFGLRPPDGLRLALRNGYSDIKWELKDGIGSVAAGVSSDGHFSLPNDLGVGSYVLEIHDRGQPKPRNFLVLIAPQQAHQPGFGRVWLLAVQLYAVRSQRNWGHGDFTDLLVLLEIVAGAGAAGVGLNPLHALPPGSPSPYSPTSRVFLNPLYIDVEAIPEFPGTAACGLETEVEQLRAADMIDYAGVSAAKRKALRAAYAAFRDGAPATARGDFQAFRDARGEELQRFAAYEVLTRRFAAPWWEWPEPWRNPQAAALAELREEAPDDIGFHEYVQWRADRQLAICCARARDLGLPVGLFLDFAVGVEPSGADAWCAQDGMVRGLSIGAPPDYWNPAGQNWHIAPLHPQALIETDFALLRRTLRAVMRYAGAIRLDHAMGLKRLFLIPHGDGAGTYVSLPFDAMLAVVAQESQAAHCLVIGEDLGTVPEGFSATMGDWGIWSYRVALFERDEGGAFRRPPDYPERALVTFATHDLPTFAGWADGRDIGVKTALGLDSGENATARKEGHRRLRAALASEGLGDRLSFAAVARFLARTQSRLLAINIEDVLGVTDQINIPATTQEYPNWRRRLVIDLADLGGHDGLMSIAAALRAEGRSSPMRSGVAPG